MFRRNSTSRCDYILSRENGFRVTDTYDFVLQGMKRSCSAPLDSKSALAFWCNPVFASYFCPQRSNGSLLAAANELGQVMLWDLRNDTILNRYAVNDAHDNAIFDLAWSPSDLKFITASGDTSVVMWDCKSDLKINKINTFKGHGATVKTCSWNPDSADMFCTGDRGGVLVIWDTRSRKPENRIISAHERTRFWKRGKKPQLESTSITGIVFYQPYYLITAAAGTAKIRMWDLRKYYAAYSRKPQPVCEISHNKFEDQSGYAYLTIDRARHRLYASSVCDRISSFALNTPEVSSAAVFTGGRLRSFYSRSCLSPDGKYLFSGSSSNSAVIWKATENLGGDVHPLKRVVTAGHEVNTVAWCNSDHLKIAAFPECESCEIFTINSHNTFDCWDNREIGELDQEFDTEVSQVESELRPTPQNIQNSRFIAKVSGSLKESVIASPTLDYQTLSNLISSAGKNKKRVLEEVLENAAEDTQNKKIKLRGRLSPRRLFISSSINDENCDSISVSSRVTNRFDVNGKDSLTGASSSEIISNSEDEEKDSCQFTASSTCVKTPFSPTSNLPNHVVDGTSPSHICKPYPKKRLDWLTELRHGIITDLENNAPKKLIEHNSCKNEHSKNPPKKGHESILKFFRILGKPTDEQLKLSPGCRVVSNNQSS